MKVLPVSQKLAENTQFFQDTGNSSSPGSCDDDWGLQEGHRSQSVYRQAARDRLEVETRKWCQAIWLVKLLRKICKLPT